MVMMCVVISCVMFVIVGKVASLSIQRMPREVNQEAEAIAIRGMLFAMISRIGNVSEVIVVSCTAPVLRKTITK